MTHSTPTAALSAAGVSIWLDDLSRHRLNSGSLAKLNNDGSINTLYSGIPASQGLWTNPANGHLISGNPLYDIDVSGAAPNDAEMNVLRRAYEAALAGDRSA